MNREEKGRMGSPAGLFSGEAVLVVVDVEVSGGYDREEDADEMQKVMASSYP
jgi:hypothetical protein